MGFKSIVWFVIWFVLILTIGLSIGAVIDELTYYKAVNDLDF